MTDKLVSEKQQERIEAALTIRSQLQQAFGKKKRVNIFASGTYKGVSGYIAGIQHGSITLACETEDGEKYTTTMRIVDIKRVSVYES